MKIDFNKNGMTINFDKVPKFLYFNEENKGCGQVFIDGVKRKGLQEIKIHGKTRNQHGYPPLKYRIQYIDENTRTEPQIISNMENELCIGIKILDIEKVKRFININKQLFSDIRVPEDIREEYAKKLMEVQNED